MWYSLGAGMEIPCSLSCTSTAALQSPVIACGEARGNALVNCFRLMPLGGDLGKGMFCLVFFCSSSLCNPPRCPSPFSCFALHCDSPPSCNAVQMSRLMDRLQIWKRPRRSFLLCNTPVSPTCTPQLHCPLPNKTFPVYGMREKAVLATNTQL